METKSETQITLDRLNAALVKLDNIYPHTFATRGGQENIAEDGQSAMHHLATARNSLEQLIKAASR